MDFGEEALKVAFGNMQRTDAARHATMICDVTILSLLIEAGIATAEQACERLLEVQQTAPERYRSELADRHTELLVSWLRSRYAASGPVWTPQVIEGGLDRDPD